MRNFFMLLAITAAVLLGFWAGRRDAGRGGATVITAIRALNRLETAAFTMERVIDRSEPTVSETLFGDRILFVARGEAVAGLDLARLTEGAVSAEGTAVALTLPPPEIFSVRLDNAASHVYDRKLGWLTAGDPALEGKVRAAAETQLRAAACGGGLLASARDNGEKQLRALLARMGFKKIEVKIPEGKC